MAIKSAEDDDLDEEAEIELEKAAEAALKKHKAAKNAKTKVKWLSEVEKQEGKKKYYSKCQINNLEVIFC